MVSRLPTASGSATPRQPPGRNLLFTMAALRHLDQCSARSLMTRASMASRIRRARLFPAGPSTSRSSTRLQGRSGRRAPSPGHHDVGGSRDPVGERLRTGAKDRCRLPLLPWTAAGVDLVDKSTTGGAGVNLRLVTRTPCSSHLRGGTRCAGPPSAGSTCRLKPPE